MTKGEKYYETRIYVSGEEITHGPFEYCSDKSFLDKLQMDMKGLTPGTKVSIWTEVYNAWEEGPWKNTEFYYIVGLEE